MDPTTSQPFTGWDLEAHALQFGRDLKRWRRRSGWAQDTAMAWAKATGIPCVFSSTWSQLERGLMRSPGPKIFVALAEQNRRIAGKQFGPVKSRALLDRLQAAEPVVHADGEAWDPADFFACYIGLQTWPHPAVEPPQITPEDAAQWSEAVRELFRRTAYELDLSPVEATVELLERGPEDRADREQLQRVVLGFEDYSPADLLDLWAEDDEAAAFGVIDRWRSGRGLAPAELPPPWAIKATV